MKVACRDSNLSLAQVAEVAKLYQLELEPVCVKSHGDLDHKTSLRDLGKTDFFTREIDELVLSGEADIAIHSAKDLPEKLPDGLQLIALTQCIDPRDALVFTGELPQGGIVGSSSKRRDEMVKRYRPDLICKDIRGTIEQRLEKLGKGYDGVVIAEAALIRLKLDPPRIYLEGETTPLQGQLAILGCREYPGLILSSE